MNDWNKVSWKAARPQARWPLIETPSQPKFRDGISRNEIGARDQPNWGEEVEGEKEGEGEGGDSSIPKLYV